MESPILKVRSNEGEDVLLLDEKNRTDWLISIGPDWFRTFFIQVVRAAGLPWYESQHNYKVYHILCPHT